MKDLVITALTGAFFAIITFSVPVSAIELIELDGNALDDSSNSADDWETVYSTGGASTVYAFMSDPLTGDQIFSDGKDIDDISNWRWTSGGVPDHDDITNAYAALYEQGGNALLYFGLDRYANNGYSEVGVWFFQNPITANANGTFSGHQFPGDLLVLFDFVPGGYVTNVDLYRWVGDGTGSHGNIDFVASGDDVSHMASDDVVGAMINQEETPSPWPYEPYNLNIGYFPAGSFIEGLVDLAALGIAEIDFSSFLVETRSSHSTDAMLKDFVLGQFSVPSANPVANAGPDQTVNEGDPVTLDGSASSAPGEVPLTYLWTQIPDSTVELDGADTAYPTFTAPFVPAAGDTLTFQLIVNDGLTDSEPDVVNITVKNVNHPPVADAGDDQTLQEGSPVTLDGSASFDEDGESLTFYWDQLEGIEVALLDATTDKPSFTAPSVGSTGETLTFELTVSDGIASATDSVDVFITNFNHPPVADAGSNQTVNEGDLVTLDGAGSFDPDSDPLSFAWEQPSGMLVTLSSINAADPTFTAPSVLPGGETLTFELTVSDGYSSDTDDVTVTVLDVDDPPACGLARANPEFIWPPNHKMLQVAIVELTGLGHDEVTVIVDRVTQDEPIDGLWEGDASPDAAVLTDGNIVIRAERDDDGGNGRVYEIKFTATDASGASCIGSVQVCVPHDRGRGSTCVDDGQLFNSLAP
jgi:hypothetical protein